MSKKPTPKRPHVEASSDDGTASTAPSCRTTVEDVPDVDDEGSGSEPETVEPDEEDAEVELGES